MVITQLPRGSAMDDVATSPQSARLLRWALAAAVAVAAGLAVVLAVILTRGTTDSERPAEAIPSSPVASVPTTVAFRWDEIGGVKVPWSAEHGPSLTTNGRASGYSRDEQGAALAAAQVLMRTSASAGSDSFLSVLSTQITGSNTVALKATLLDQYAQLRGGTDVPDGAPIPGADAEIVGYRLTTFDAANGAATVDVVVDSADLRARGTLVSFAVSLVWSSDDWRVLAPPRGDWGAIATQLSSPPAGLLPYDTIG